jgi:Tol biopolymer transport system component
MIAKTDRLGPLAAVVGALAAVGLLIALMMLCVEVKPAEAAYPGKNGRIAYQGSDNVIYTIRPGGEGKTKVTEGQEPAFSADGKKIAYTVWDGNDAEIYTIKLTGGRPFQVTNNDEDDYDPSWSPDGKKIAYTHYSDEDLADETGAIYMIAAGGGSEVLVTDNDGTGGLDPSWGSRP